MLRSLLLAVLTLPLACAHSPTTRMESLKRATDTFHKMARWRDYRGASELVISERRMEFTKGRMTANDDRDLTVTDYQLEDAKLSPDGNRAEGVSRINWMRLPSVTEETAVVTTEMVYRDGTWFVARQDKGPFEKELSKPVEVQADGGISG
ncbi:MAG: hypothetical protein ACT4TC_09230 [Myxococcaceae bacterium]